MLFGENSNQINRLIHKNVSIKANLNSLPIKKFFRCVSPFTAGKLFYIFKMFFMLYKKNHFSVIYKLLFNSSCLAFFRFKLFYNWQIGIYLL